MSSRGSNYDGASQRLADLFERRQGEIVSRAEIAEVAEQLDPLKRIRRNGGARDILDAKGIALLWGRRDRELIRQLGLGRLTDKQFILYTPKDEGELKLIRSSGHSELQSPF